MPTSKPEKSEPRRRGRPPLPKDNETRERLLDAALRLFAERSFTQVSVREITEAAGQSLGTVNYHFGSKEGLISALAKRSTPSLIEERQRLLHRAQEQEDTEAALRAILYALLAPVIQWSRQKQTQELYLPFLKRVRLDGPSALREVIESEVSHLHPFMHALQALFPHLDKAEVGWRLHFILGIEHEVQQEVARLTALIGDDEGLDDVEAVIQRMIDFVVPGWLAGVS